VTVDEWRKLQGLPPIGDGKGGELRFQAVNETLEDGFVETPDEPVDDGTDGGFGKPTDEDKDKLGKIAAELRRFNDSELHEIMQIMGRGR
jgi:hypothetical protein